MENMFFQALHSAPGANAAFALGYGNHGGGFGIEQDRVPDQDVWIGVREGEETVCLPFFKDAGVSSMKSFTQKNAEESSGLRVFTEEEMERRFQYGTDTFKAGKLEFQLISPVKYLPDPENADYHSCKYAFCPGIIAKLIIDNTAGTKAVEGIFGVSPMRSKQVLSRKTGGALKGFISEDHYGFAAAGADEIEEFSDFSLIKVYQREKKVISLIAPLSGITVMAAPGERKEVILALGWYKGGTVTAGLKECNYYYTRFFADLTGVLDYTLECADRIIREGESCDTKLECTGLSTEKKLLLCQSVKSYYYSSMLFHDGGKARWVTNEGAFRMMNTLDLSVDHVFFELEYQPWAVRNQLESFADDYSYYDQCGLSFTHDQGTHQVFSPKGYSSYEIPDITECFSYMSQEQLCNWILIAAVYTEKTQDNRWAASRGYLFRDCLSSMKNRDSLTGDYTGIMSVDSDRCGIGAEITTYDSLDSSLGQASKSLYLAVKCWASYLALERLFACTGMETNAEEARQHAELCSETIISYYRGDLGFIPAILDGRDATPIIPAIEGLVYPYEFGRGDALKPDGAFGTLITILKHHLETVLETKVCLFPDGGWKLSANNGNSWMSKIFLCEYVADDLLHCKFNYRASDAAHVKWWTVGCPSNPGIDQILEGTQDETNFHYPRAVTSFLWMR